MPTSYFAQSTHCANNIVKNNLFGMIDDYIDGKIDSSLTDKHDDFNKKSRENRIYHIAATSVNECNFDILNKIRDKIDITYNCNDGNTYKLIQLAVENMLDDGTDRKILEYLVDLAKEKSIDIGDDLSFASRMLCRQDYVYRKQKNIDNVGFAKFLEVGKKMYNVHRLNNNKSNNDMKDHFELIDYFIENNSGCWNMYHYSIAWNNYKITEHLLDNHIDKIDASWTQLAIETAKNFGSNDSIFLVKSRNDSIFYTKMKKIKSN